MIYVENAIGVLIGEKGISMLQGCLNIKKNIKQQEEDDKTTNYGLNHENLFLKS